MLLLNITPLKKHRNYRLLFSGQVVSFIGSMITYVAVPYQVYELTHSSSLVGLLGAVQLIPLLIFALVGGAQADVMDRRRVLISAETILTLCSVALMTNSYFENPNITFIFVVSAIMAAVNGFHRPAMEAITQVLVPKEDMSAVAALGSIRYTIGAIIGPAIAGIILAKFGIGAAYGLDVFSYAASLTSLALIRGSFGGGSESAGSLRGIFEGIRYAWSRPELLGTYFIDIAAMIFAMPAALFPAMSHSMGGAKAAGWLYAAMPIGSAAITFFSGWTSKVSRHGAAVIISATCWGLAIIALGFTQTLPAAVIFLALAGAADSVSGIFRGTIWNQTIPANLRGRLAGIEMISYMSGPLLGNARAGYMADAMGEMSSIALGGVMCVIAILGCSVWLREFWSYDGVSEHPEKALS